jgi:hypothetical protein
MRKAKAKTLIAILTAAIMLLIPILALAADPPALVPKTGQTTIFDTGDDGYYQTGISIPNPRFTDNSDGTITDNLTGLVWLKNASCYEEGEWIEALTDSNALNSGECGLTDGSAEGDWRLPNRNELNSLVDVSNRNPALSYPHPFTGVLSTFYWTSTSANMGGGLFGSTPAWKVNMDNGEMIRTTYGSLFVWPVRGPDRDEDGLQDHEDNCPTVSNPNQKDVDSNNIGDVCDPNTVYGTMSGDVQEGVSIDIGLVSCGGTTLVATTTTNSEGFYIFSGLSNGYYEVSPQNTSYVFNLVTRSVQIPQGSNHAYNFIATLIRFVDNGDGTVTDTLTDLVWLKDANCYSWLDWEAAISSVSLLSDGECDLSDGSIAGEWRLASKEELQGIGTDPPAWWHSSFPLDTWTKPSAPFVNVQSNAYWSGTTYLSNPDGAWFVGIHDGITSISHKFNLYLVWPVRSAN